MNKCTHHWQIAPAQGPTSRGKCRRCGEVRTFNNTLDDEYVQGIRRVARGEHGHFKARPVRPENHKRQ